MKTSLTIEGTPAELARVLAMLGGNVAVTATSEINATEDDESGDADAPPGTLDKNGLPWDERIHSTPAKLTGKNLWRAKRGVTAQLVAQVEAELRARTTVPQTVVQPMPTAAPMQQAPMQQFQPTAAPVPQQPVYQPMPMQQPMYQPPVPQQQPMYQPPVPQQQPMPTAASATGLDFNGFMMKIQELVKYPHPNGGMMVDANVLNWIAQQLGGTAITDFAGNQEKIDAAIKMLIEQGRWA